MDYSKAFWPKLSSFFVVLLLLTGMCYEAEICTVLLLLQLIMRCSFQIVFFSVPDNIMYVSLVLSSSI